MTLVVMADTDTSGLNEADVLQNITSIQQFHIKIERGASIFLTVLKIIPSGFLNTHSHTVIP